VTIEKTEPTGELLGVVCLDCRAVISLDRAAPSGWEQFTPANWDGALSREQKDAFLVFATAHESHRVKWCAWESLDEFKESLLWREPKG
jgi:hypothetical protein